MMLRCEQVEGTKRAKFKVVLVPDDTPALLVMTRTGIKVRPLVTFSGFGAS